MTSTNIGNAFTPAGRNIGSSFNNPSSIFFNQLYIYGGDNNGEWNSTTGVFTAAVAGLYSFQLYLFNNGTTTTGRWLSAGGTAVQFSSGASGNPLSGGNNQQYLMFNQSYGTSEGQLTTHSIYYMTAGQTFYWYAANQSPSFYYAGTHTTALITKIY